MRGKRGKKFGRLAPATSILKSCIRPWTQPSAKIRDRQMDDWTEKVIYRLTMLGTNLVSQQA